MLWCKRKERQREGVGEGGERTLDVMGCGRVSVAVDGYFDVDLRMHVRCHIYHVLFSGWNQWIRMSLVFCSTSVLVITLLVLP